MKKVLTYACVGLAVGSVISTVCIALMSGFDSTIVQVLAWLAASVLYGLVSLVYESDRLPLPAQIGVHLLLCYGVTLATAGGLGYADSLGMLVAATLPSFLIIYVVITAVALLSSAHTARQINEKLR